MHALRQDLRFAARSLARSPGFTVVAVVALALGIGANSAIFSLTDALLVHPVRYPNIARLVSLYSTPPNDPDTRRSMTAADFEDVRRTATSFEVVAAVDSRELTIVTGTEPALVEGAVASPGLFDALGVQPMMGRTFLPEEEQPGRDGVVVLHHALWKDRFDSDPNVVGRTITVDGRPRTIVGVMGTGVDFPLGSDLWIPYSVGPELSQDRSSPQVEAVARLKPGVSSEEAAAEMRAIAARLAETYPDTNAGRGAYVLAFADDVIDEYTRSLMRVLLAAVGLVLLVACANVSNLQLARATSRRRELAVRLALGASRWKIVRQLLIESVLLALAGCAAGVVLALWLVDIVKSGVPASAIRYVPGLMDVTLDVRMLAVSLAISAAAGVAAGILPALSASRTELGDAMKDSSKGATAGRGSRRVRTALVVSEIALTLALLVGSGMLVKHFVKLATQSNGYDPAGVLTMRVSLPDRRYPEARMATAFFDDALRRISALPGVDAASAVRVLPSDGNGSSVPFEIEGRPTPVSERPQACQQVVTTGYFDTLRIQIVSGRGFAEVDREDAMPVAMVSEGARRRYWLDEDPVGSRVRVTFAEGETRWVTIVGVVADVKQQWTDRAARPTLYLPLAQRPRSAMWLAIRSSDPSGISASVRAQLLAVDPEQPVSDVRTLTTAYEDSISGIRVVTVLMGIFGAMALLLATVGVYGVMAYAVTQRRHEVGVRMALGARPADVQRIVLSQALRMTAVGLAVGLPLAGLLGVGVSSALDGAIPFDPVTLVAFAVTLCAVALSASYVPALRASRTDPNEVLHSE